MKLAKEYARALFNLQKTTDKESKEVVDRFISVLKKKGHIKLLPLIVEEYEKISLEGRDTDTMSITCARKSDFAKYKDEIERHMGEVGAKYTEEIIDDTIIGGFILKKGETAIDGSYKKKLLLLYQNVIA